MQLPADFLSLGRGSVRFQHRFGLANYSNKLLNIEGLKKTLQQIPQNRFQY